MADACQPQQRNLYQTKFAHLEYRDGLGNSYNEQLRQQSFPERQDAFAVYRYFEPVPHGLVRIHSMWSLRHQSRAYKVERLCDACRNEP